MIEETWKTKDDLARDAPRSEPEEGAVLTPWGKGVTNVSESL